MVLLSNCNLGKNIMFTGLLKYFTFTFLIWTYLTYHDLDKFTKLLEKEFSQDKRINLILNRLLSKHNIRSELDYGNLREKLSDDMSIYLQMKKKKPNNFEAYIKDYNRRYRKKKGIFKLDCYCEKKVFDKILYVKELSEKFENDKKRFKKKFLKKYGIGLILFTLIPALGFIYPLLLGVKNCGDGVLPFCTNNEHTSISSSGVDSCPNWHNFQLNDNIIYMRIFNNIFSFTMITIILTFLIYILLKIIKYEKLKAGKGKMNLMEYCRFCKDVFI